MRMSLGQLGRRLILTDCHVRGPNWIHGTEENPVLQISQEVGVSLCAVDDTMQIFEPSGTSMPKALADEELETVWSLIDEAFKYSNEECLDIRSDLSLEDFFKKKLSASSLSHDQQARVLLLAEMWGSFIGDSWERQSLRWFWLEECLEGGENDDHLFGTGTHTEALCLNRKPLCHGEPWPHRTTRGCNGLGARRHSPLNEGQKYRKLEK